MAVKANNSNKTVSCIDINGMKLCLKQKDIVEPREKISIKELLNRANKLARMDIYSGE